MVTLPDADWRHRPGLAALIEAFVPLDTPAERSLMASLSNLQLHNWRGIDVGRLAAHAALRHLAPPGNSCAA